MPRAYRHLTWRCNGTRLQTLVREHDGLQWVTVARATQLEDGSEIEKIAEALNRARFTLFDIRPAVRKKKSARR